MSDLSVTINADTTKFISAVKESKKELDLFDKSNKQLRSTMMKVNDVTEEQVNAFKNSVNSLNKVSSGTKNTKQSISILKDEVKKLSIQFNNLSDAAKKSKFGDTISNQVRKARTELERLKNISKETSNSLSSSFKSVENSTKNATESSKKYLEILSDLEGGFRSSFSLSGGGLFSALSKLTGPIAVVTTALVGVYEVVKSNETLFDEFRKRIDGVTNSFSALKTLIGNGEFSINVLMSSYNAGKEVYDAKDTIETAQVLNAPYKAKLDERLAKAKLLKKEGRPEADAELNKLKGEYSKLYNDEIKRQQTYFDKQFKDITTLFGKELFTELEDRLKKDVLNKIYVNLLNSDSSFFSIWSGFSDYIKNYNEKIEYYNKKSYTKRRDDLRKKDEKFVEALKKLVDLETSKIAPLAITATEIQKLNVESNRIQGEVEEAKEIKKNSKSKAKKKDIEKPIQDLYKELDKWKEIIDKEDEKDLKDRDFGRRKTALEEYYKLEDKIYKQFGQFEGENSQVFWREWTNVERAVLEGKDINEAIKKARANIFKYITERGITIEKFVSDINEVQENLGKDWPWYKDTTAKYYNDIYTNRILMGVGSPEEILELLYERMEKDINQLTSKYPDPKSQSYFKEIADIYDNNLKYLKNYENELESLKRKRDELIDKFNEDYDEEELNYLREYYEAKKKKYQGTIIGRYDKSSIYNSYSIYNDYVNKFLKKKEEIELLDKEIAEIEKKHKAYQELKNLRDSKLQEVGIRPYPAFVFEDYKKDTSGEDRIKLLGLETNAVNNLASAWNNLGEVISIENNKIEQAMKAFGNFVADTANMLKSLAENELAASQAVALGKATSSASGLPFPYNLVAMATVAASVTSMFARFASIGKFAEGGIVGGSSLGGDQMIARVNSGEMILNGSQQKKLFNLLNGNGTNTSTSIPEIKVRIAGSDLVGVLDNYGKKLNRVR